MPPALHQQATPVSGGRAKPSPILLFVPVLLAAIFGGWLLGQQGSSGPSDTTPPATPGETRPAEQPAPEGSGPKTRAAEAGLSQAEIAMSMLRAYEDGNISKQPALLTAAERYLQKANQEDPGHVNTLTASGWLKYYQNKYNDGLIMFERAIAEDPIHAEAWLGKARILKETGNYELALINADQTIRLDSLSVAGRLLRAEILGAQGDIDGAEAEIDDLMKFNSQYSKAIIYQERLGVFKSYDNDRNGLIMPGDISANDGKIHEIQNSDGKPGLSIEEFRVRGETSIETTASGQTLFQYDLSDPENPKIREWQKAE